jgi:hypothetical protein
MDEQVTKTGQYRSRVPVPRALLPAQLFRFLSPDRLQPHEKMSLIDDQYINLYHKDPVLTFLAKLKIKAIMLFSSSPHYIMSSALTSRKF